MTRIDGAERRRRLAARHALAPSAKVADPVEVTRRVVALHSTDPATVFISVHARTHPAASVGAIEATLYERRELIRMLGMRRTMFVVPSELVDVVQVSTTDAVAATQRSNLVRWLSGAGGTSVEFGGEAPAGTSADALSAWLADVERCILAALADKGGSATASELTAADPRLKTSLLFGAGKAYEVRQTITSRVLLILAAQGHVIRGRPTGTWISQQYEWHLAAHWRLAVDPDRPALEPAAARADLARAWLAAFGPARLADLKWWTGWTMTQARRAVGDVGAAEVDLDDGPGIALADDVAETADPGPWAALLPALDPTVMGWQDRSWFLGPHGSALFDTNGNAGPTVWLDGRVVGGWAQRAAGPERGGAKREVVFRLFEDVGADALALIQAEVDRLGAWLGDVRIVPRFRTPTERELSS